jgi:DNA-directed RNA polymerase subunit M/transcription elongation factor TFIIS
MSSEIKINDRDILAAADAVGSRWTKLLPKDLPTAENKFYHTTLMPTLADFIFKSQIGNMPQYRMAEQDEIATLYTQPQRKLANVQCSNCKGKNTGFTIQQRRSGDEGEKAEYDCGDCGYMWK